MHLHYDTTEIDTLVFAPAEVVREIAARREQATSWRTWGDAREALSPERFDELHARLWDAIGPDDDEPFDAAELSEGRPWPALSCDEGAVPPR